MMIQQSVLGAEVDYHVLVYQRKNKMKNSKQLKTRRNEDAADRLDRGARKILPYMMLPLGYGAGSLTFRVGQLKGPKRTSVIGGVAGAAGAFGITKHLMEPKGAPMYKRASFLNQYHSLHNPTHPTKGMEGRMAQRQLQEVRDMAEELMCMIEEDDDLHEWVQHKLSTIKDRLSRVHSFMYYEQASMRRGKALRIG